MERLLKVLGVVVVLLVVSQTASAVAYFATAGGTWSDDPTTGGWGYAPTTASDYVYMYTSSVSNPGTVAAGSTVVADFVHFDAGSWYGVDNGMIVNGTANIPGALYGLSFIFGSWGGAGTSAQVTVNEGGSVNLGGAMSFNANGVYDIVLNGGDITAADVVGAGSLLTIDFLGDATFTTVKTTFDALIAAGNTTASAGGTVGMLVDNGDGTATYGIVPEPATLALLGLGALVLRRKK